MKWSTKMLDAKFDGEPDRIFDGILKEMSDGMFGRMYEEMSVRTYHGMFHGMFHQMLDGLFDGMADGMFDGVLRTARAVEIAHRWRGSGPMQHPPSCRTPHTQPPAIHVPAGMQRAMEF